MEQGEIVVYKTAQDAGLQLEVKIEDETVWLTQAQMAELFEATKQNVSLHINNVFKEKELDPDATVKEYLTVRYEGSTAKTRPATTQQTISTGTNSHIQPRP